MSDYLLTATIAFYIVASPAFVWWDRCITRAHNERKLIIEWVFSDGMSRVREPILTDVSFRRHILEIFLFRAHLSQLGAKLFENFLERAGFRRRRRRSFRLSRRGSRRSRF